jgi:hypothetical protein
MVLALQKNERLVVGMTSIEEREKTHILVLDVVVSCDKSEKKLNISATG